MGCDQLAVGTWNGWGLDDCKLYLVHRVRVKKCEETFIYLLYILYGTYIDDHTG